MKKFLMILSCLFFVQNAYCGNPPFDLDGMKADYLAGKIDLATATTLCEQIINYAKVNDIEIFLPYESDDGKQLYHSLNLNDCESSSNWGDDENLNWVWNIALYAAKIVAGTDVKEHSQCHQLLMESKAQELYAFESASNAYTVKNVKVYCSKTDNRCVVTGLTTNKKSRENKFLTICYFIPVISCEFTTSVNFSGVVGYTDTKWKGFSDSALTLNDFSYDCKPNME